MNIETLVRYADGREIKNEELLSEISRGFNPRKSPVVDAKRWIETSRVINVCTFFGISMVVTSRIFGPFGMEILVMIVGIAIALGSLAVKNTFRSVNAQYTNAREFAKCMTELELAVMEQKAYGDIRHPEFSKWDSVWTYEHCSGLATDFLRAKAMLIRHRQMQEGKVLDWKRESYRAETEKLRDALWKSLEKLSKLFPNSLPINRGFYFGDEGPKYVRVATPDANSQAVY